MSIGLGPQQRRLLDLLSDAKEGVPVGDVPALLGVEERRARSVVASLVDRDEVVVERDLDLGRRVWLSAKRRQWQRDREYIQGLFHQIRELRAPRQTIPCQNCGCPVSVPLSAEKSATGSLSRGAARRMVDR